MHKEMEQLQVEKDGLHDQINQLNEEIGEERGQFQDQISYAEKVNSELQEQVDQVTKIAEEL